AVVCQSGGPERLRQFGNRFTGRLRLLQEPFALPQLLDDRQAGFFVVRLPDALAVRFWQLCEPFGVAIEHIMPFGLYDGRFAGEIGIELLELSATGRRQRCERLPSALDLAQ